MRGELEAGLRWGLGAPLCRWRAGGSGRSSRGVSGSSYERETGSSELTHSSDVLELTLDVGCSSCEVMGRGPNGVADTDARNAEA